MPTSPTRLALPGVRGAGPGVPLPSLSAAPLVRPAGGQWTRGGLGSWAARAAPGRKAHGAAGAQSRVWEGDTVDPGPRHLDAERGRV